MAQININDFIDANGNVIASAKVIRDLVSSNNALDSKTMLVDVSSDFEFNSTHVLNVTASRCGRVVVLNIHFKPLPVGWMPETVWTTKQRPVVGVVGSASVDSSGDGTKNQFRTLGYTGAVSGYTSAALSNNTIVSFTYLTRD